MEKDQPSTWNSTTFAMDCGPNELNPNNPADCFLNPNNWDSSMDQNDPFESALSSIVSSPTAATAAADGFMIRELLGRLGSISNSGAGELSPQSCIAGNNINSTNTSCYSTPLNSPPKLNLSSIIESRLGKNLALPQPGNQLPIHPGLVPLKADPGFVERAARFSCFGNRNYAQFENESEMGLRSTMPKSETGKLSRVSSNLSVKVGSQQMGGNHHQEKKSNSGGSRPSTPETMELGDSREGSSISEQNPGGEIGVKAGNESNSRKRKSVSSKVKAAKGGPSSPSPAKEGKDETNAKRRKEEEDADTKKLENKDSGEDAQKQNKQTSKQPEPPKDYIHVRARRGQATDSHSLAERVRREKISERMKFLQDLVPGCNKVTGKAVVLDEIINYVQSLQRQVEFLSMKLATINPRVDVNMDDLLSNTKDIFQCIGGGSTTPQAMMYPLEMSMPYLQSGSMCNGAADNHSFSMDHLGSSLQRNPSIHQLHSSLHGFADTMTTQMPTLWDDDLQTVVQMGFAQNQAQGLHHGTTPTAQMKVEL